MNLKYQKQSSEGVEKKKEISIIWNDNDYDLCDISGHDSGSLNNEPQISDDIKDLCSVNEHLFSVLGVTTIDAARSELLNSNDKMANQVMVDRHDLL